MLSTCICVYIDLIEKYSNNFNEDENDSKFCQKSKI